MILHRIVSAIPYFTNTSDYTDTPMAKSKTSRSRAKSNSRKSKTASSTRKRKTTPTTTSSSTTSTNKLELELPSKLPSLLVVGTFLNLWLLQRLNTFEGVPTEAQVPAVIFCVVNGFRCLFPNRYNGNVVLHDTTLSSIFLTRTLATAAEVAWIYQLGWYAREISQSSALIEPFGQNLVNATAWSMVVLCMVAQGFVWLSLLLETVGLMWYEEACWAGIFVLNTGLNVVLLTSGAAGMAVGNRGVGVYISLLYAVPYLVFQIVFHLPDLGRKGEGNVWSLMSLDQLRQGATKALFARNPSSFASAWGGTVGLIWMTVYWVVLPLWPMYIAEQYQAYYR